MLTYMAMIDSQEDQTKFEKVYFTYRGLMYHTAYAILKNKEEAEDAVHDAFVKIAENISKIDVAVCPKTQVYVVTIAENKAIDRYRTNRLRFATRYVDEISGVVLEETRVHGLAACIAKLPPRYRQVILLKYYIGFSCKEIARHLNITEANAIKLDQRAKNRLFEMCKREEVL